MATYIKAKDLEVALIRSPVVAELQRDSTVSVPAMLMALADVESSYQLDAAGDGGMSLGLWQVNSKVWSIDRSRIGDVNYQLEAVRPVFEQANASVQKALDILRNRGLAGETAAHLGGIIKRPTAAQEQPLWYSIIWQYGAGSLTASPPVYGFINWIAETFDTGTEGFAAYRKAHGRKLEATYYTRQKRAQSTYAYYLDPQYVANAAGGVPNIGGQDADQAGRADFMQDVVQKTGADLAELPGKIAPYLPLVLIGVGLGVAAWSTARRSVTG
jgi:hypothetical protein